MNRKLSAEISRLANLLTEADPLAARAVRAMAPDGRQKPVANKIEGNVITLQNEHAISSPLGSAARSLAGQTFARLQPAARCQAEGVEVRHEQ